MKKTKSACFFFATFLSVLLSAGCSPSSHASAPIEAAKIPSEFNKAFDKSTNDARQVEADYVSAVQGNDPATAFLKLQTLSARNDLTPEQRTTSARAMATTFQQLRLAAESGNSQARTVMQQYLSTR